MRTRASQTYCWGHRLLQLRRKKDLSNNNSNKTSNSRQALLPRWLPPPCPRPRVPLWLRRRTWHLRRPHWIVLAPCPLPTSRSTTRTTGRRGWTTDTRTRTTAVGATTRRHSRPGHCFLRVSLDSLFSRDLDRCLPRPLSGAECYLARTPWRPERPAGASASRRRRSTRPGERRPTRGRNEKGFLFLLRENCFMSSFISPVSLLTTLTFKLLRCDTVYETILFYLHLCTEALCRLITKTCTYEFGARLFEAKIHRFYSSEFCYLTLLYSITRVIDFLYGV